MRSYALREQVMKNKIALRNREREREREKERGREEQSRAIIINAKTTFALYAAVNQDQTNESNRLVTFAIVPLSEKFSVKAFYTERTLS